VENEWKKSVEMVEMGVEGLGILTNLHKFKLVKFITRIFLLLFSVSCRLNFVLTEVFRSTRRNIPKFK